MKKKYFYIILVDTLLLFFGFLYLYGNPDIDIKELNEKIKEYEYVGAFQEDYAAVIKDGKVGFINKLGDLVIPMKWDVDKSYNVNRLDASYKFVNGRCYIPPTEYTNAYIIDKKGNELYSGRYIRIDKTRDFDVMYVYNQSGHSVYFVQKDAVKKMELYENEQVVVGRNWNYYDSDSYKDIYFSLEKLCYGNLVGKETLETKYGYIVSSSSNYSLDGVGLITLYNIKTNKYGIVDEKGNVVVPFQYDNNICLCYGLLIETISVSYDSDIGLQKIPVCVNVYKDGRLLYEHLPCAYSNCFSMGFFLFRAYDNDMNFSEEIGCDESEIPEINNVTKELDMNGKEVSRFQFGKNYLRFVDGKYWQLEDEGGQLVYPNQFDIDVRFRNTVVINDRKTYKSHLLNDTGDTIPPQYDSYLKAGIVKMTNLPDVKFLCEYKKRLSKKDNYNNCHFRIIEKSYKKLNVVGSNGLELLPFDVDEVSYFSQGLLRVKLGNRYFFVDEKGNGLIED